MNKVQLIRTLGFLLFFLILDRGVGMLISYLAKSRNYDTRIEKLLNHEIQADAYIVGSSRAARNFSPEDLSTQTGLSVYSLGLPGSNISYHKLVVDLILNQDKKPEFIFLTIGETMFNDNSANDIGGLNFPKDVANIYIENDFVLDALGKNKILSFLSSSYRQNGNLNNALSYLITGQDKQTRINTITDKGGMLLEGHSVTFDTLSYITNNELYSDKNENSQLVSDFIYIVNKTNEEGVKLILTMTPFYGKGKQRFKERIEDLEQNLVVFDFSYDILNKNSFYDRVHLNKEGATEFTNHFSKKINEYFESKNN